LEVWFAQDSLLEAAVQSELVSEAANSSLKLEEGALELRHIPGRLWMIAEAEESYFALEYARILVFAPRQLLLLSGY